MTNATKSRSVKKIANPRPATASVEPLPFFAKVGVERHRGVPIQLIGKIGVVLGRAEVKPGQWNYSVFIGGLNEAFSLPRAALKPTGEVVKRSDIYGGEKIRVVVDEQGAGSLAKP